MKKHNLLALALLLAPLATLQAAVRVIVHQPPPGSVSIEQLWSIEVVNEDATAYSGVYLHIDVYEGLPLPPSPSPLRVAWADTEPFDLAVGETKVFTGGTIAFRSPGYIPGYEAFVRRTGSLPDGDYTVRVTVMGQAGARLGSGEMRFTYENPSQLRLIAPYNGSVMATRDPMLRFFWAPPAQVPSDLAYYMIEVARLRPSGDPSEADLTVAIRTPYFVEAVIPASCVSASYSPEVLRLTEGNCYAWRISALNSANAPIGRSEIWWFRYAPSDDTTPVPGDSTVTVTFNPSTCFAGARAFIEVTPGGGDVLWPSGISQVGGPVDGRVEIEVGAGATTGIRRVQVVYGGGCSGTGWFEVLPPAPEGMPIVLGVDPNPVHRYDRLVRLVGTGFQSDPAVADVNLGQGIEVRSAHRTSFPTEIRPGIFGPPYRFSTTEIKVEVRIATDARLGRRGGSITIGGRTERFSFELVE